MTWMTTILPFRLVLIIYIFQGWPLLIDGSEGIAPATNETKTSTSVADQIPILKEVPASKHANEQDVKYSSDNVSEFTQGYNSNQDISHSEKHGTSKNDRENLNAKTSKKDLPFPQPSVRNKDQSTCSIHPSCSNVSHECVLNVSTKSISKFKHLHDNSSFIVMNLGYPPSVTFLEDRNIVQQSIWVWTKSGKNLIERPDFREFHAGFSVSSMGLLNLIPLGPSLDIEMVHVKGNCQGLQLRNSPTDRIISEALKSLTVDIVGLDKEPHGHSLWCNKQKMIHSKFLYHLSQHVPCPLTAWKYKCCSYVRREKCEHRVLSCDEGIESQYDASLFVKLYTLIILLMAIALLAYSPIYIMKISRETNCYNLPTTKPQEEEQQSQTNLIYVYNDGTSHVTLLGFLFKLLIRVCRKRPSIPSRLLRSLFPFLSLSIVAIQFLLDNAYLHGYVLESVNKGVPLGFRSMLAGYTESRKNFLPYLGGPFVACGIYILLTELFLVPPKSMRDLLLSGFNHDTISNSSPLFLTVSEVEKIVKENINSLNGYCKLYSLYRAQFFMLRNSKFWVYLVNLQQRRKERLQSSAPVKCLLRIPYAFICLLEWMICLLVFGLPVMSFMLTVIRAYCKKLYMLPKTKCWIFVRIIFPFIVIVAVMYVMVMLFAIFLDAFFFAHRVVVVIFMSLVAYPTVAIDSLRIVFPVMYQIKACFIDFNSSYRKLLKKTIQACKTVRRERVINDENGFKGITSTLFEHVIQIHSPRHKQVLESCFKPICMLVGFWIYLTFLVDKLRVLSILDPLVITVLEMILETRERGGNHWEILEFKQHVHDIATTIENYYPRPGNQ